MSKDKIYREYSTTPDGAALSFTSDIISAMVKGFDININTTTFTIELKCTNNLNKLAKWKANLEITVESI